MTRSYIWSLPTRLFHILLITFVGAVFIVADFENLLSYHVAVGFTIGVLFIFRIGWGFLDIKYSKFEDFNFKLKDLQEYMLNVLGNKKEYIGHNPASSWAIIAMIILGLISVFTGMVVYGAQEGMGVLFFLNSSVFRNMELFEEIHELFANAFMAVVFIHIAGVTMDRVLHKSKAVESMISGYKNIDTNSLKLTLFQKIYGVLWIVIPIYLLIYLLTNPSNILIADANKKVDYKIEHQLFYNECKSCHTLYPPFLLPKKSWTKIMNNLENHFGDDASLNAQERDSILSYLLQKSSESSTKESALKIAKSIKNPDTISITKTSYWKKKHDTIDKTILKSKKIGKISNCKACHQNIEQGLLNDKDIKIPNI